MLKQRGIVNGHIWPKLAGGLLLIGLWGAGCGPRAPQPEREARRAPEREIPVKQLREITTPCRAPEMLDPAMLARAAEPYDSGVRISAAATRKGRTAVRLLYGFEDTADGQPVEALMRSAENIDIIAVLDNGVTEGRQCGRLVVQKGSQWGGTFNLTREQIRDWSNFDYFAIDVYTEHETPCRVTLDLLDALSSNYHSRATIEGNATRRGAQTILFQINRARRNAKEGRDWEELEPQDKIDLKALKGVRITFAAPPDQNGVFWVDNLRLMQEDAARPKLHVELPQAVVAAFDFGSAGAVTPGFEAVTPETHFAPGGFGLDEAQEVQAGGTGWPDLLAGTFLAGRRFTFKAAMPNGEYRVWLCAGQIIDPEVGAPRFRLTLNEKVVWDEQPSPLEYDSEKYIYRFMWTQYSQRPHALWLDYVNRMYPVHILTVRVHDGLLNLAGENVFVSALVAVPASAQNDFERMAAKILQARLASFESLTYVPERAKPQKAPGDGAYVLFVPEAHNRLAPWTQPTPAERGRVRLESMATPGENVFWRLAVVPFENLGACALELGDLKGSAGVIPAEAIKPHFVNYRHAGHEVAEMVLLPSSSLYMEAGLTQCYWLWLRVPEETPSGRYSGVFVFHTSLGDSREVPVNLEVLPFRLEKPLPMVFGMYYGGRCSPNPPADRWDATILAQFKWMKDIGFTSATVPFAGVGEVDVASSKVKMRFDDRWIRLARQAGLAATDDQPVLLQQLGIARVLARQLPEISGAVVDQQPGIELRHPRFRALWFDAMRQYKQEMERLGIPYAMEIVDEPREVPNPWNRNLADTITYGQWMGELGLRRFVTPMGDVNGGKDYTPLVDAADIISVHGNAGSARLMERTRQAGKTLWVYNNGMDRFSWGVYPWAHGIRGRKEWHWSWTEGRAQGGYPGNEWYNPFTALWAFAPNAPLERYPGGFLYTSYLLTAAEGITDYAYFYTLERRVAAARAAGRNAASVAEAEAFIKSVRAAIPMFAENREKADMAPRLAGWRSRAAELLRLLSVDD